WPAVSARPSVPPPAMPAMVNALPGPVSGADDRLRRSSTASRTRRLSSKAAEHVLAHRAAVLEGGRQDVGMDLARQRIEDLAGAAEALADDGVIERIAEAQGPQGS